MNLPEISLPFFEGITGVPLLLHPVVIHFIIVLPLLVLIVELVNTVLKRKSLSVFSFVLLLLVGGFIAIAYVTGSTDGKAAWDALTPEGQEALKAHKTLGAYLAAGFVMLLFFKIATVVSSHPIVRMVFVFFLIAFMALLLKQGKDGGELVYTHGANVAQVKILDDKLFDLEYEHDDLLERHQKLQAEFGLESNTTQEPQEEVVTPKEDSASSIQETTQSKEEEVRKLEDNSTVNQTEQISDGNITL